MSDQEGYEGHDREMDGFMKTRIDLEDEEHCQPVKHAFFFELRKKINLLEFSLLNAKPSTIANMISGRL